MLKSHTLFAYGQGKPCVEAGSSRGRSFGQQELCDDDVKEAIQASKTLRKEKPQLQRQNFRERLGMEQEMMDTAFQAGSFIMLVFSFCWCVGMYDPIENISEIHQQLRTSFELENLDSGRWTPDTILRKIDGFVSATYDMASALIDANTMNSIDFNRCLDSDVTDICNLKFWNLPNVNKNDAAYLDILQLQADELSPRNHKSKIDCKADASAKERETCIDRQQRVNKNLTRRTFGLTPEDPIIMNSRLDYPMQFVVPLAPLVFQTRAKRVKCDGFGNVYNQEILGAGTCSADTRCDPKHVSSFANSVKNLNSQRWQDIYVTYVEDAFFCVDRYSSDNTFRDKSWHPWATFKDLTDGVELKFQRFGSQSVVYKFISNSAYLQAPITGSIYISPVGTCEPCGQQKHNESAVCTDPVEEGAGHPMWAEKRGDEYSDNCSMRKRWTDEFLAKASNERRNTFITLETTELTVAALVITPQGNRFQDVVTLVELRFTFKQSGLVEATARLTSTSETLLGWYFWIGIVGFFAVLNLVSQRSHILKRGTLRVVNGNFQRDELVHSPGEMSLMNRVHWNPIMDLLISASTIVYLIINIVFEKSPPNIVPELTKAFADNSQEAYFNCYRNIYEYGVKLSYLKTIGFFMILCMFERLTYYLALHPRLSIMVRTMKAAADDIVHFMIYLLVLGAVLAFLAVWSFGIENPQYASVTSTVYTMARMFIGDFVLPQEGISFVYAAYLIIFVFICCMVLLNFFLAIIVKANDAAAESIVVMKTENSLLWDIGDTCHTAMIRRLRGWPHHYQVIAYLDGDGGPSAGGFVSAMPGITADELLAKVKDENHVAGFKDYSHALSYINFYKEKVLDRVEGVVERPLEETRPTHLCRDGAFFDAQDDTDPTDPILLHEAIVEDDGLEGLRLHMEKLFHKLHCKIEEAILEKSPLQTEDTHRDGRKTLFDDVVGTMSNGLQLGSVCADASQSDLGTEPVCLGKTSIGSELTEVHEKSTPGRLDLLMAAQQCDDLAELRAAAAHIDQRLAQQAAPSGEAVGVTVASSLAGPGGMQDLREVLAEGLASLRDELARTASEGVDGFRRELARAAAESSRDLQELSTALQLQLAQSKASLDDLAVKVSFLVPPASCKPIPLPTKQLDAAAGPQQLQALPLTTKFLPAFHAPEPRLGMQVLCDRHDGTAPQPPASTVTDPCFIRVRV
eukprot:TRINITY_DN3594_c0_g1_i12.p1 TRINITY_DN3594_c0_g1~~TRINITY_DN3594_c0_g1_i12.p1  ORF type:complete len:1198 (+),score=196.68 TRINITY_DN3594_c0_g1_i12:64-3657(+)